MVFVDHVGQRPPLSGQDEWGVGWTAPPERRVSQTGEHLLGTPAGPASDAGK